MELFGKTILITGASTGIGKELALRLAAQNNRLILLSRRLELLNQIKDDAGNKNQQIDVFLCDVSDHEQVKTVFKSILDKHKTIDISILNSGVSFRNSIEDFDASKAKKTFDINVMGVIYCIEQLLPMYMKEGRGIITGVSSLADARGFAKSGFYCASKAALSIYLESLRSELKPYGVKVITIKPGFVKTPLTDKNEFKMPMLMSVNKAVDIIIAGLTKEKTIIQFPFLISAVIKFVKLIPNNLFDYISINHIKITGKKD
ncbi:MAG: SDR family NAD(P)-dependent oxidoreductase [Ignavibacteriaceae bacterium]|nr:SDR family NAD(P)-dependent oxidoreductase [Ignavibacteriaceae bacterium]